MQVGIIYHKLTNLENELLRGSLANHNRTSTPWRDEYHCMQSEDRSALQQASIGGILLAFLQYPHNFLVSPNPYLLHKNRVVVGIAVTPTTSGTGMAPHAQFLNVITNFGTLFVDDVEHRVA